LVKSEWPPNGVSAGDYLDWSRQNTTFKDLKAVAEGQFNISSKDQPISVEGASLRIIGYLRDVLNAR
jgi:putative ABC transport system permease protein